MTRKLMMSVAAVAAAFGAWADTEKGRRLHVDVPDQRVAVKAKPECCSEQNRNGE